MTILHMQTEDVLFLASQVKRTTEYSLGQLSQLTGLVQGMEWIGESNNEFRFEVNQSIKSMEAQLQFGDQLAARIEKEVAQWESTTAALAGESAIVPVARGSGTDSTGLALLPLGVIFTQILISPPVETWANWLRKLFGEMFPQYAVPPAKDLDTAIAQPKVLFENPLPEEIDDASTREATSSAALASSHPDYETYYMVPPKSQGETFGRAACLPTSISMVTDYFHAQDPVHVAASPDELIDMLDVGDGTTGKGVGFDKLNDDLNQIGYRNVKSFQSDLNGLMNELKGGPVVVNVKVNLLSIPERAIAEGNGYNHAIVVKAVSADKVLVNDPWAGKEIEMTNDKFERMWKNGDYWMETIHP